MTTSQYQSATDEVLLSRYIQGEKSAYDQLINRHGERVRNYIAALVKDEERANDIYQEVLIKAVKVIDEGRYTHSGRFLQWLMRIAHNRVLDIFRAERRITMVRENSNGYSILNTAQYAEGNIEDQMVRDQILADIQSLIEALPAEQKEVVMLRYYEDLSFKEIAERTGVSINTALGRVRYALINLRKAIGEKKCC